VADVVDADVVVGGAWLPPLLLTTETRTVMGAQENGVSDVVYFEMRSPLASTQNWATRPSATPEASVGVNWKFEVVEAMKLLKISGSPANSLKGA